MRADTTVLPEDLRKKTKAELLALWAESFNEAPPRQLRRPLLVRLLAYKIQEKAYGGLTRETRERLRALARGFAAGHSGLPVGHRIKPGTRLIRQWSGRSHEVTVVEGAFEYAGRRYASLSEIARAITGTRWSGPLFFGLKTGKEKRSAG